MTDRTSPKFGRTTPSSESERIRADPRSARIFSLSEEGVYAETLEKFYLSSVLVTHLCLL